MAANTVSKLHNVLMPYPSLPLIEIDLHVAKIEEYPVERMNGLKDGLFGREQQSSEIGCIDCLQTFAGSCDKVDVERQALRRFNIDFQRATSEDLPTAATATRASCAKDPVVPFGQVTASRRELPQGRERVPAAG